MVPNSNFCFLIVTADFHFGAEFELQMLFIFNTVLFLVISYIVSFANFIMGKTSNKELFLILHRQRNFVFEVIENVIEGLR
jgi:hypothetical protein